MKLIFDPSSIEDYHRFLAVKALPKYRIVGTRAEFPDEYAGRIGMAAALHTPTDYAPISGLFDYQRAIARLALTKGKFAVFADCGLGKTLILLEYARHVAENLRTNECVLIICPLMVVEQTLAEAKAFYGNAEAGAAVLRVRNQRRVPDGGAAEPRPGGGGRLCRQGSVAVRRRRSRGVISIQRDGTKVKLTIAHGLDLGESTRIAFTWECHSEMFAELLQRQLSTSLNDRIEAIRREAYKKGWKDAKSKRVKKATDFAQHMQTGIYIGS